jgi:hypothetical protein
MKLNREEWKLIIAALEIMRDIDDANERHEEAEETAALLLKIQNEQVES